MSDFRDTMRADIEEREKSLQRIRLIPTLYDFKEQDRYLFLKYSVVIIYAIWEGFLREIFNTYIKELNKLEIQWNEANNFLIVYHVENTFKELGSYPKDINKKIEFIDKIHSFSKSETIAIQPFINTESNADFEVVNKLLSMFNLKKFAEVIETDMVSDDQRKNLFPEIKRPKYKLREELGKKDGVKTSLLHFRNNIAHGHDSVITVEQKDIDRFILLVEILMQEIFDKISEGYTNKTYLKEY